MTIHDREELEEERDFLLASLQDLERERAAGELSERDYQSLHADYTARAAVVLRALERGTRAQPPRGSNSRPPVKTKRPLIVTLGVIVLVAAVAGGAVATFSGERQPGAPMTGSLPETPTGRLQQALQLESTGKAADALKIYDELIRENPRDVAALSYRGWLLKRAGLPDQAMASLDAAIAVDPRFPDAHFFKGMVLYQDRKDPAAAVVEFRLFMSNNPPREMVPLVEDVLRRAMADAGQPVP
ncbi:MAG TPA: tetratricopeptide repeat protein [Acidimicrobiales bacterium]|nr:tetratricopeptide repeat protein [Acidimicrobiales bacterium]